MTATLTKTLPTVDFYGNDVTRLLLGDNPFIGNSYVPETYSNEEMLDYYTADAVVKALFEAEESGINTYMAIGEPFVIRALRQYRNEGGKLKIIFQSYPAAELETNLWQMMACDPVGIYHQGGTLDVMVEEDEIEKLLKRLELIKKTGVKAGLGTHYPETLLRAEKENWGMDFYAACVYNARRGRRGKQSSFITGEKKYLVFYKEDPPLMYEAIRNVPKPCIAFKVFAGGQVFTGKEPGEVAGVVESVMREAFGNIKPIDLVCFGVFQKHKNQIRENAEAAARVLGE